MNKSKLFWIKKGIWLVALAIFFYATYNATNIITIYRAQSSVIAHIIFDWETYIPLIPWTILPYWTENLLYGLAILSTRNTLQLRTLGMRLFAIQIICIIGFLLFPLQQVNALLRPEVPGFFGWWFDELMKFDHPYNQAPSLHVSLVVILWVYYCERVPKKWHPLIHLWALLIIISVLTTWQHHFIDIPTGIFAGSLAIWCIPKDHTSPLIFWREKSPHNWKWMGVYLFAASLFLLIVIAAPSFLLWSLYPAASLILTALNYGLFGKKGFPKQPQGTYQATDWILFLPYILIAKFNAYLWTRNDPIADHVIDRLYIGKLPTSTKHLKDFSHLIDCAAEIPFLLKSKQYTPNFLLDMTPLSVNECQQSSQKIAQAITESSGNIFVSCALGYSRSATSIAAYLISHENHSVESAVNTLKSARTRVVINASQLIILQQFKDQLLQPTISAQDALVDE